MTAPRTGRKNAVGWPYECVLLGVVVVSAVVDDVSCRFEKHGLPEQQVSTYMLGNLDGEEKEGESTAAQLRCLSLSLSLRWSLRSILCLSVRVSGHVPS